MQVFNQKWSMGHATRGGEVLYKPDRFVLLKCPDSPYRFPFAGKIVRVHLMRIFWPLWMYIPRVGLTTRTPSRL